MKIVILGNGISGITAARHLRKLTNHSILVVSDESAYFFARTALMYVFMGQQPLQDLEPYPRDFWEKNRIELYQGRVDKIDFDNKMLFFNNLHTINYDKLILAVGSLPRRLGMSGEHLNGVFYLYHLQDIAQLERLVYAGVQQAVIVGGGLIGVELAEMLHSRGIKVTFLVREKHFWGNALPLEEAEMLDKHLRAHHIDLRLSSTLSKILDDGQGNCVGVVINNGEIIPCQVLGVTIGVRPNVDFLKQGVLKIHQGILINQQLETNIPDVYAIGDCAEMIYPSLGRKVIEAVWYTGRRMGEVVAHRIAGNPLEYAPGIWFNSAKFFDIEYQTYGEVPIQPHPQYENLFWQHPFENKSIRLVYDLHSKQIMGFNLMGVRYRQGVCQQWIQEKAHIETVLRNLSAANFEPEFFKTYEKELVQLYTQQTGVKIKPLSPWKRFLRKILPSCLGRTYII